MWLSNAVYSILFYKVSGSSDLVRWTVGVLVLLVFLVKSSIGMIYSKNYENTLKLCIKYIGWTGVRSRKNFRP